MTAAKTGIASPTLNAPSPDLVRRLSSTLGVKAQAIGVAGLKDARAITTQMVSLQGIERNRTY